MPQAWQTAWSLSTNSAIASSSGIGPERQPAVVGVETRDDDAAAGARQRLHDAHDLGAEELRLVDTDDVERLGQLGHVAGVTDGHAAHPQARVGDDVGGVEPVVDRRLEHRDRLAGDLGPPEAPHQLLALAGEHRAADDLEPAACHRVHAHHGRKPTARGGRPRGRRAPSSTGTTPSRPSRRRSGRAARATSLRPGLKCSTAVVGTPPASRTRRVTASIVRPESHTSSTISTRLRSCSSAADGNWWNDRLRPALPLVVVELDRGRRGCS